MANLKRFPNPGSKIEMLIYIFKAIKGSNFNIYYTSTRYLLIYYYYC